MSIKQTPPHPHPCSSWTMSRWIEYQPKSNEKYMPFLQTWKVLLIKICKIQPLALLLLYFLLLLLAFTSADIIFHHFLELRSEKKKKKKKKDFCCKFSVFSRFTQPPPHPLNDQNQLSMTSFLLMLCKEELHTCIGTKAEFLAVFL